MRHSLRLPNMKYCMLLMELHDGNGHPFLGPRPSNHHHHNIHNTLLQSTLPITDSAQTWYIFYFGFITIRYISSKIIKTYPILRLHRRVVDVCREFSICFVFSCSASLSVKCLVLYRDTLFHVLTIPCCICKHSLIGCWHGPLTKYVKLRVAHAPGMTGVTHVPWCMPGSLTFGFPLKLVVGKTLPAFPAHSQPATNLARGPWHHASMATRSVRSLWVYLSTDLGHSRLEYHYSWL